MTKLRKNIWIVVLVFGLIGDGITTSFASVTPGLYELNPIWRDIFNNQEIAMFFLVKGMMLLSFFFIDYALVRRFGSWAIPAIPVYFAYSGTYATINNFQVLANIEVNVFAIALVFSVISIVVLEYLQRHSNYEI